MLKYEVIIMPDGAGGNPEVLKFQSPRAGLKGGGKAQTEEEKKAEAEKKRQTEEAAKRAEKEFEMSILHPKREFLDEITSEQYRKIKAFEIKAKEKPIGTWNFEDVKNQFVDILKLYDELVRNDVDIEAQKHVKDIATYCFSEYVKRPEAIKFEIPGEIRDRIQEMQIVAPPEVAAQNTITIGTDVLKAIKTRGKRVKPEIARELWKEYYKEQGKDFASLPWEERQALELAIRQGIAPEYHRTPERVLFNASIPDTEEGIQARITEAELLLDTTLTSKQRDALMAAHRVGIGELGKDGKPASIYNYTQEQIKEKTRFLVEAFDARQREKLMESGLAGAPIAIAPTAPPELQRIAEEINRRPEVGVPDRELRSKYLQDQVKRVQDLIDRGTLGANPADPGVTQAYEFITTLEERMAAVEEAEEAVAAAREQERYNREPREQALTQDDVDGMPDEDKFDVASYTGSRADIKAIADRVGAALIPGGVTPVSSEFLRNQLRELFPIMLPDNLPDNVRVDAIRLRRELEKLQNVIYANVSRASERSNRGIYDNIRLTEVQKQELIDLAILANPNPDPGDPDRIKKLAAWRELEGKFNRHFAQADVNSSDPWRDALGQAGNMEIEEFLRVLNNAAESKTSVRTVSEQERLRESLRRLKREMNLREYLHNLSFQVNTNAGAEDIIKAASQFPGQDADVAFRKRGVSQVLHWYEDAMLQVMVQNGGYLPATAMINTPDGKYGEVEAIVFNQALRAREMGALPADIADWEIRRAISLGRGMGIVTGRFFEIVAEHGIPKNNALNSWWANGLVKNIAFFRQLTRFNVGQQQRAVLGYMLEGGGGPWSTDELKKFRDMSTADVLDNLVNESDNERLVQMKNPFHIGSIFTQTGWRWKNDKVNLASATSHLLQEDENNPLIGIGLLIEAKRGDLAQHEDKVKQKKAHDIVHHGLELASEITPLKLFYNLTGLRQDVLRKYYSSAIREDLENAKGSIFIESKQLQDDLQALALVQEKLLNDRVRMYQEDIELKKANPNYQFRQLPVHLNFAAIGTADPGQVERITQLAEHIKHEFHEKHMEKLIHNLEHKGWKVPWVLGTDDIPYEALNFSSIPGDTIARRWSADILPVVQTAGLYGEFISNLSEFKSQHDIVKSMKKIHNTLSGHDAGVANEAMRYLAEGVGKFYKKDWTTRLPFGVGKLEGYIGGQASYAQVAFGRGQMAWDELDMQEFLHHLHASGLMDHHQIEELKDKLGAENYQLAWAMLRTGIPMLLFGFIYMMLLEQLEQAKKS